jgi:hypothetical protein
MNSSKLEECSEFNTEALSNYMNHIYTKLYHNLISL